MRSMYEMLMLMYICYFSHGIHGYLSLFLGFSSFIFLNPISILQFFISYTPRTILHHVIVMLGMMSSHRHQWPPVVKGEDGLYIGKTCPLHETSHLFITHPLITYSLIRYLLINQQVMKNHTL